MPKRYSSRKELKILAMRFAERNRICRENSERFLIEVDKLKSNGNLSDLDTLVAVLHRL